VDSVTAAVSLVFRAFCSAAASPAFLAFCSAALAVW
jgi:hypothetical protein